MKRKMTHYFYPPEPKNEPILMYAPGTEERKKLKNALDEILKNPPLEIPIVIGGKEIHTEKKLKNVCPHDHSHVLANVSIANEDLIKKAINNALEAKEEWMHMPFDDRAAIFLKTSELLSGKYRYKINAAAMLGMSKNVFQAEIDSACELIDFLRFNVHYAAQIYALQPFSPKGQLNRMIYRPLEGFIFAVSPFNFLSIAGNLPTSPAIMGNVVVYKPASSAVFPAYLFYKILQEAGLPPGVINFVPCPGRVIGEVILKHKDLAGVHFTGSTWTFQYMWKTVGENIENYESYPRLVGETGGKDFIFIHSSADIDSTVTATVRGAFEYQGQKCSAASRVYCPSDLWPEYKEKLLKEISTIKMGSPVDFENFMNAVIDEAAFDKIMEYIKYAKEAKEAEIIIGGKGDKSKGYFIEPTVIVTKDPKFKTIEEEIFGPVLTIYVYDPKKYEETLKLCDETSPYGLTGSIFAQDREAILKAQKILYYSAGNFYINDKPTGAVVGQQPFGGARASGTNDKAGSLLNLLRWVTPQTIKETFDPPKKYRYPSMDAD
jgi:1-pyrroline-5-carboxylate dehydrogenase